jgi:hypothetical protein
MSQPSLATLPAELLEHIARPLFEDHRSQQRREKWARLNTTKKKQSASRALLQKQNSVAQLRLVCKELNFKLTPIFREEYFTHRTITLSSSTLIELIAISKHPDFGPAVRRLCLRITQVGRMLAFDRGYMWTLDGAHGPSLSARSRRGRLSSALKQLVNCNQFEIVYPNESFLDDGVYNVGKCYDYVGHYVSKQWYAFRQAIVDSNRQVHDLRITANDGRTHTALLDSKDSCLPSSDLQLAGNAFAALRSLTISFAVNLDWKPCDDYRNHGQTRTGLVNFLNNCSLLETLKFTADWKDVSDELSFLGDIKIPRLKSFSIADVKISGADLGRFLQAHSQTLERLRFDELLLFPAQECLEQLLRLPALTSLALSTTARRHFFYVSDEVSAADKPVWVGRINYDEESHPGMIQSVLKGTLSLLNHHHIQSDGNPLYTDNDEYGNVSRATSRPSEDTEEREYDDAFVDWDCYKGWVASHKWETSGDEISEYSADDSAWSEDEY